ncbi:hypothetical protein TNCV_3648231 [Trichonephila clavipes]|nr:hypothetical protein TNCV_3648231 [Trichonephila clavipes]
MNPGSVYSIKMVASVFGERTWAACIRFRHTGPSPGVMPPLQPIGVNVHFTQHPTREQPLSSQSCQKTPKTYHPDEAR